MFIKRTSTLYLLLLAAITCLLMAASASADGPAVSVNPPSFVFSTQSVASHSAVETFTVTNSGTEDLVFPLHAISLQLTEADFYLAYENCSGQTISPGENCQVYLFFLPITPGSKTGTLVINDNAPDSPQTVALSGQATPLVITPEITVTHNPVPSTVGPSSSHPKPRSCPVIHPVPLAGVHYVGGTLQITGKLAKKLPKNSYMAVYYRQGCVSKKINAKVALASNRDFTIEMTPLPKIPYTSYYVLIVKNG